MLVDNLLYFRGLPLTTAVRGSRPLTVVNNWQWVLFGPLTILIFISANSPRSLKKKNPDSQNTGLSNRFIVIILFFGPSTSWSTSFYYHVTNCDWLCGGEVTLHTPLLKWHVLLDIGTNCFSAPFHLPVSLRVVRCCSQTCYATKLLQSVKEFILEHPSLIMNNFCGETKP